MKKAKFLCLALENKVELYNFTYQEIVNAFPVKLVAQTGFECNFLWWPFPKLEDG